MGIGEREGREADLGGGNERGQQSARRRGRRCSTGATNSPSAYVWDIRIKEQYVQSWPKKFVLGCVVPPLAAGKFTQPRTKIFATSVGFIWMADDDDDERDKASGIRTDGH